MLFVGPNPFSGFLSLCGPLACGSLLFQEAAVLDHSVRRKRQNSSSALPALMIPFKLNQLQLVCGCGNSPETVQTYTVHRSVWIAAFCKLLDHVQPRPWRISAAHEPRRISYPLGYELPYEAPHYANVSDLVRIIALSFVIAFHCSVRCGLRPQSFVA